MSLALKKRENVRPKAREVGHTVKYNATNDQSQRLYYLKEKLKFRPRPHYVGEN